MKKNDIKLIITLMIAAFVVYGGMKLWQWSNTQESAYVRVTIDEELYGEFPLNQDYSEKIDFGYGQFNTLVIENGEAYILDASCPDQICVNHFHIHYAGDSIVCLPHKLVVTVIGGEENQVDTMTN